MERLVDHINGRAIVIADAKRGDIGNTSRQYAKAILENMGCDAITISLLALGTSRSYRLNVEKEISNVYPDLEITNSYLHSHSARILFYIENLLIMLIL